MDYYDILGVKKGDSPEEIKRAFRKKAHQYHPDKGNGDEKKFKEVNEAYQVLSNKEKRAQYDQFGQTFSAGGGPASSWGGFDSSQFQGADFSQFGDIFEQFFSGRTNTRTTREKKGNDLQMNIQLTLEEAFSGIEKEIRYKTFSACAQCAGQGYEKSAKTKECVKCKGLGEIRETRSSFFGQFQQILTCPDCSGRGLIPEKVCKECKGDGRIIEQKQESIQILPGVRTGQLIKMPGGGEAAKQGAAAGDLYIQIKVLPHKVFQREGDHLIIKKSVEALDILLDNEVEIPSISGDTTKVRIPKELYFGQPFRIAGKGMPRFNRNGRGDLFVKFDVENKGRLSKKEKELLEKLKEEE